MKLQVGVKVLIRNDIGKFLFIQRSFPLPDGTGIKWDIPGGRINPDEKLADALRREVLEEIGVDFILGSRLLSAQDIIIPDVDLHVVRLTYTANLDKQVILGDEHQSMKWLTLNEVADIEVDPYLREVLDNL